MRNRPDFPAGFVLRDWDSAEIGDATNGALVLRVRTKGEVGRSPAEEISLLMRN
jgi:hypothetical protein